jgi:hypothetical protein
MRRVVAESGGRLRHGKSDQWSYGMMNFLKMLEAEISTWPDYLTWRLANSSGVNLPSLT